jgi:arylsulfatase A-like enzyme
MLCLGFVAQGIAVENPKEPGHVVVVVWDGMRPDFVTEHLTPTLYKLAREGVVFRNHHAVYPSSTVVNGTALVTGVYPNRNGIMANNEYRPEINPLKSIGTPSMEAVDRGDESSGGRYLTVPTLAEIIQKAGYRTAVAGTKPVALMADRSKHPGANAAEYSPVVIAGAARPAPMHEEIVSAQGAFPAERSIPKIAQNRWTTRALTEHLWKQGIPAFSLLWLSEPDASQHEASPGSPTALAALKSSDDNLQTVLAALEEKHARESTDVFVVSDHGFSTIERSIDFAVVLRAAGFNARREFSSAPEAGEIMVAGNGGTALLYVTGHDAEITRKLVDFLQRSDFAGAIFTRKPMEGTFTLDKARIDTESAPDVVVAFQWTDRKNAYGVPGFIITDDIRKAGQGSHATLSPHDMHNTLVASGPHFLRGSVDALPSSNADVAPTILHILGVAPPVAMDGRVLREALAAGGNPSSKPSHHRITATRRFADFTWSQSLRFTTLGNAFYLDEGRGGREP